MDKFRSIYQRACQRKGGEEALQSLLSPVPTTAELRHVPNDRALSLMTKVIFQSGFSWKVIDNKWSGFEEVFKGFDIAAVLSFTEEEWEAIHGDKRIVRNGQKIKTIRHNAQLIDRISRDHGSMAAYIADWPSDDQIGLLAYLKKNAARLGGNSGMYFLRFLGFDGFVLSRDVIAALQMAGLDINDSVTSKRDFTAVQAAFNAWEAETGLPYTHLSQILGNSAGVNYHAEQAEFDIEEAIKRGDIPQI